MRDPGKHVYANFAKYFNDKTMTLGKRLILFISVVLVISTIPVSVYILKFNHSAVSTDPAIWGVFGDYVGGLMNPLISLANLILLAYLTYQLSLHSSEENKKLSLFQKRVAAFEEITLHLKEVNLMTSHLSRISSTFSFVQRLPLEHQRQHLFDVYNELSRVGSTYSILYQALFLFKVRHGHFFKYDFNNETFKKLLADVKVLAKSYDAYLVSLGKGEPAVDKLRPDSELLDRLASFIISLHGEILDQKAK